VDGFALELSRIPYGGDFIIIYSLTNQPTEQASKQQQSSDYGFSLTIDIKLGAKEQVRPI